MTGRAEPSRRSSRYGEDAGYNLRRQSLLNALLQHDTATAAQLAAILGWELREVSAKLQDLRRNGMADRDEQRADRRLWWAT